MFDFKSRSRTHFVRNIVIIIDEGQEFNFN